MKRLLHRFTLAVVLICAVSMAHAEEVGEHLSFRAGKLKVDVFGQDHTAEWGVQPIARFRNEDISCAGEAIKAVNTALGLVPSYHQFARRKNFEIQVDVHRYTEAGIAEDPEGLVIDDNHIYVKAPLNRLDHVCVIDLNYSSLVAHAMRDFVKTTVTEPELARRERKQLLLDLGNQVDDVSSLLDDDGRKPASGPRINLQLAQ